MSGPRRVLLVLVAVGLAGVAALWLLALRGVATGASETWSWHGRAFELSEPRSLLLLCALPMLLVGSFLSLTGLSWQQRALSFLLRGLFLGVLVLGLARPVESLLSRRVCAVALLDVSASTSADSLRAAALYLSAVSREIGDGAPLRVVAFGANARLVDARPAAARGLLFPEADQLRSGINSEATDIAGAIELARAWTPSDCVPRYLLLTDGIETRGDALGAITEARRQGVRLSTFPLAGPPPRDVAILSVELPAEVTIGETFEVRVELRATAAAQGTLRLLQGGVENGLGGRRQLTLEAGRQVEVFQSVARVQGEIAYRAEYQPASPDGFAGNNVFTSGMDVPGPPRVLLVDRGPEQLSQFARALVAQQLDVEVRAPTALPESEAELRQFAFVVLSDVSRAEVSRSAEQLLLAYVRRGGGLLVAGGEAAYGPGGWQGSELEKALPVRMDAEKEREVPGVALALVIDRSGSMTGLPLAMAKEACAATLGALSPSDLLEVIAFDSEPTRFVRLQPARHRSQIEAALLTIQPGGGTELFSSLDMAYQDLAATEARKKHIVLLTDGNASSDGLYDLAAAAFAEGITVTTVGLGTGTNAALLTTVAEAGGGRFHTAESAASLPRIFTHEAQLLSRDAAPQDWFPVVVAKGADFLAGVPLGSAPYLRGFTQTQQKSAPAEHLLQTEHGAPLLSRMRVGLGWTLAWTSDLKPRWATDWLRWAHFPKFAAQLVRAHQSKDDATFIAMTSRLEGREVVASFDAFDRDERFDSTFVSRLTVQAVGAQGVRPISVPFLAVAPGHYEARTELPDFGAFALRATHSRPGRDGSQVPAGSSRGTVSWPYPEEYRELEPRLENLRAWAQAGGGSSSPSASELLLPRGDHVTTKVSRHGPLIYLSLLLLLLDLFVRRVRLFDRGFRAKTAR